MRLGRLMITGATIVAAWIATLMAPPATAAVGSERVTATVHRFDARIGTLDLVTGVGMALRIRRIEVPAHVKVEVDGAASTASALVPGCVVRVECHHEARVTVASKVTLIRPAPAGRRP